MRWGDSAARGFGSRAWSTALESAVASALEVVAVRVEVVGLVAEAGADGKLPVAEVVLRFGESAAAIVLIDVPERAGRAALVEGLEVLPVVHL